MSNRPKDFFSGWTPTPFNRKNLIINGDFRINQRGGTYSGSAEYGLDRWYNIGGTSAEMFQTTTFESRTWMRLTKKVAVGATMSALQPIEVIADDSFAPFLIGETFTLSFDIYTTVSDVDAFFRAGFATDKTLATRVDELPATYVSVTASETTRVTQTFTVTTGMRTNDEFFFVQIGANKSSNFAVDDVVYITNVQLELGDKATEFEWRHHSEELELCQRYFQRINAGVGGLGYGGDTSGTTALCAIPLSASLRAAPSLSVGAVGNLRYRGVQITKVLTGMSYLNHCEQAVNVLMQYSSVSGWAAGAATLYVQTATTVDFDAEL